MEREHNLVPEDAWWKRYLYRIIYRSDTKLGKLFDIILLLLIMISTAIIMMESIPKLDKRFHYAFIILEWIISIFFSIEYALRIAVVKNKRHYIFSFFGIIDFLALVPFYLSFFFPVTKYFLIFRMLRMLRVFRVFNLMDFSSSFG
jgi:voltage-gated potassium channel